ncbi:MAG: DUF2796 domain-containing protein [Gammaproteobacteria bacterium]|nr:DUF2796 domain-containing protein [Gammaproteobacteria bacterium]MBU1443795.1 DUF2796 domain-containing protein [Gammaproteobacteria bacterium]MBU2288671.1 DUF2796 domain-containing protein [Gammaproteobacteria bacterium]MBU2410370.1 DUF2796 domain-containing protein [Gammaproteobacteria bacterium]
MRRPHLATTVITGILAAALPAAAQQHAHTHGRLALDVAVDAQTITLAIESPLDGFLGFERAPRSDAERQRVADMVRRLNAADALFQPDPAAECRLSQVKLVSSALGLGVEKEAEPHRAHGADEHADIDVDIVFTCAKSAEARFIDVKLFEPFKRIRTIDAQVASPQGQFKRTLAPGAARLSLTR